MLFTPLPGFGLSRSAKKLYRVLVRPTKQGEFLLFPKGWRDGGKGYVLSRTLKYRLEAPGWHRYDSVMLVLGIGLLLAVYAVGWVAVPPLLLALLLWRYLTWRRQDVRQAKILALARPSHVRLTRERFELEYASQFSRTGLFVRLVAAYGVGFGTVLLTFYTLDKASMNGGSVNMSLAVALLPALLVPVVVLKAYQWHVLLGQQRVAWRAGVAAGDAVDVPIPAEDWRVVEDVEPVESST